MMVKRNTENIAYEAYDLTFNGSNYIDTGVYFYTAENINRDFELIAEGCKFASDSKNTLICAKHDSLAYGFFIRAYNASSSNYAGTLFIYPNTLSTIKVRRISGNFSLEGDFIPLNYRFNNSEFSHPLVLGCGLQDNGTPWRYAKGTIAHIKVAWL